MRSLYGIGTTEIAKRLIGVLACVLLSALSVGAADASGYRQPLVHEPPPPGSEPEEEWLVVSDDEQVEGACGAAFAPSFGPLYVSDYYHHSVGEFSPGTGERGGSILLPDPDPPLTPRKEANSVCGLATDYLGNLYGNYFHGQVVRLLPSEAVIDPGYATGIAVDEAGNLYVNHRTYLSVYAAPVDPGDLPIEKIGEGSLGDAYGVAVDSKAGKVYVPDASDETVKVYEPAIKLDDPVDTIDGPSGGGFSSLTDTSLAVDSSETEGEGHLLVVDNLKPLYERPAAAVYEFDSEGKILDRLQTRTVGPPGVKKEDGPIFGEPSGVTIDPKTGTLYVTTGNSEEKCPCLRPLRSVCTALAAQRQWRQWLFFLTSADSRRIGRHVSTLGSLWGHWGIEEIRPPRLPTIGQEGGQEAPQALWQPQSTELCGKEGKRAGPGLRRSQCLD